MNKITAEALFLFLILLLGLVLCSFLGGNCGKEGYENKAYHEQNNKQTQYKGDENCENNSHASHPQYDNYNHYSGSSSSITNGKMYYGTNGETATISTNSNGKQMIHLMQSENSSPIMFTQSTSQSNEFNGPSGFSATVVNAKNTSIHFTFPDGTMEIFTQTMPSTFTSSEYFGSTGTSVQKYPYHGAYQDQSANINMMQKPKQGYSSMNSEYPSTYSMQPNQQYSMQPNQQYSMHPNQQYSNNQYANSLPPGIPASQIPSGQEDLYILKSEVVPPVCPACPTSTACPRKEKCPPCPACARCPEPSFECKKVPNYDAINEDFLPQPVVNDFSQFGM